MKVLLASTASHAPPRGGATRSNLAWLEQLARRGHECRVVGGSDPGKNACATSSGVVVFPVAGPVERIQLLRRQIVEFRPDWVLVSSEDVGQRLLAEAHASAPGRVIYLGHTPQWFPFGPESWAPDASAAELVKRCAGIVVVGRHMAGYVERHTGRAPAVVHPPIYGHGPFPNLAAFEGGLVTMINPCAVKGVSIFLDVARAMPEVEFGVMPGWGTTAADRAALSELPNIRFLPNCRDIEEFLRHTRVLLMPSLWYEGFGLIVIEAMLHGIPVVASDSGGLVEAKQGAGFVIPVRRIERYEPTFDERSMPRPVIPPQPAGPWIEAVRELLTKREVYEVESASSRAAAEKFLRSVDPLALEKYLLGLGRKLRVLLAQNSPYFPAYGGGDKSNRLLMEALAARGHCCSVVARTAGFGAGEHARYLKELGSRGVAIESGGGGAVRFRLNGVEAHVVTSHPNLRGYFSERARDFAPDAIVASTNDPAHLLLDAALKVEGARVIYIARATLALPFGPDGAFPSPQKTAALRQVDRVVGVSRYVAEYIRRWSGIEAIHVPVSLMEPGPYAPLGRFDNEFVTLVNPCAVKGITILLELADRMPGVRFAAVPTWGTNENDRSALAARANIRVLDPVDRIEDLFSRTRVLLAPSLWAEARSRIVVEAMLAGVPVLASNIGGIPEAMLGAGCLLPVRPIEKYRPQLDEQMVPVAEVPRQDVGPWQAALEKILGDRAHWEEVARESRRVALEYVENLNAGPFERVLEEALTAPRTQATAAGAQAGQGRRPFLDDLSPEKRRLLALRLRKKTAGSQAGLWFPPAALEKDARLRLFCFPHAGGGTSTFHGWGDALGESIAVCPVRLPGRESRAAEQPFRRMDDLVTALAAAVAPHLERPFGFFGHSMGAAIGFELTRRLRREGRRLPVVLIASGARAPQYRLGRLPPPEPPDEALLADLHRLDGMPAAVLENRELVKLILPALKADASLYRNYLYFEEPPLNCAIRAYGGDRDPNVSREQLEAWGRQTAGSFAVRLFPGGHFFLQTAQTALWPALAEDLEGFSRG